MQLLAPAGSVEHFLAALEAGADAVYVGAPGFNARNPAREISFAEIRAMVDYGRSRSKSVYVALNSLVREADLPQLLDALAQLEVIAPEALIVQDFGVIELVTRHFRQLKLHGSTLMFAHNSGDVEMLAGLGCSRVVLARELTLGEIDTIVRNSPIEIEIFIHGAMCFSYSGACLFSSYHGGKSGLRGNCVQPCRRKFSLPSGKKSAYLFSMNDLQGIEVVDQLKKIGIASLKVEGRLRSVNYVEQVIRAYRLVLDAGVDELEHAKKEAGSLIDSALGRKSSSGYFLSEKPKDLISARHSGNIGSYLGSFSKIEKRGSQYYGTIALKQECASGDRLRLHFEASGERLSFTLKELQTVGDNERLLLLPADLNTETITGKVDLYRVDVSRNKPSSAAGTGQTVDIKEGPAAEMKRAKAKARKISSLLNFSPVDAKGIRQPGGRAKTKKTAAELWLKLDTVTPVFHRLPFSVDRFVLPIERRSMADAGRLKNYFGREKNKIIWSLPPVAHEKLLASLKKDIGVLIRSGFRTFQVAHPGQMRLFEQRNLSIFADYTFNLLNSRALELMTELGLTGFQFSIETDRAVLKQALAQYRKLAPAAKQKNAGKTREKTPRGLVGLTVYGAPPLFISRATPDQVSYNQVISSPKGEKFVIARKGSESYTRPLKPFSLLPFRKEFEQIGLDYLVIDLAGLRSGKKELEDLAGRLEGRERGAKLPTFNYQGTLE